MRYLPLKLKQKLVIKINPFIHPISVYYMWPPEMKTRLTEKDPDARNGWKQEEKGTTEDEMVGWHHWLDGHEFE